MTKVVSCEPFFEASPNMRVYRPLGSCPDCESKFDESTGSIV